MDAEELMVSTERWQKENDMVYTKWSTSMFAKLYFENNVKI